MSFTIYKSIKEAFNSPYEIKPVDQSDSFYINFPGTKSYKFTTEEGITYLIIHSKNSPMFSHYYNNFFSETLGRKINVYAIDFLKLLNPNGSFNPSNYTQDISPSRNFVRVFSTVINEALDYYSKVDIDFLAVTSKNAESNRASLYTSLANKFAIKGNGTYIGDLPIKMMGANFTQHLVINNEILDQAKDLIQEFNISPR